MCSFPSRTKTRCSEVELEWTNSFSSLEERALETCTLQRLTFFRKMTIWVCKVIRIAVVFVRVMFFGGSVCVWRSFPIDVYVRTSFSGPRRFVCVFRWSSSDARGTVLVFGCICGLCLRTYVARYPFLRVPFSCLGIRMCVCVCVWPETPKCGGCGRSQPACFWCLRDRYFSSDVFRGLYCLRGVINSLSCLNEKQ